MRRVRRTRIAGAYSSRNRKMRLLHSTVIDSRRSNIISDADAHVGETTRLKATSHAVNEVHIGRNHVYGDFATGLRTAGIHRRTGDFATGTRIANKRSTVGDFATGMRTLTFPVAIHDFTSSERALPAAA